MTEDEKTSLQYRFSGYLPPLVSLGGSTEPGYWCKFYTHPYYVNQPQYWQQPSYNHSGENPVGDVASLPSNNVNQLYATLPVCTK